MAANGTVNGTAPSRMAGYSLATRAMHADDEINSSTDVAPPLHVSTTFRYTNDPQKLIPISDEDLVGGDDPSPKAYIYSRLAAPNTTRLEKLLDSVIGARTLTYGSGLAAFHAMLVYFNPKVIAIGDGYHGCHGVIGIMQKVSGLRKVDLFDEASWDAAGLGSGDIVHVETPLNPTGEAFNLEDFAAKAHKRGAILTVDATFGPPGLQDPFAHGVDVVMHSGTKYFGGHSDMLCGVLGMRRTDWWTGMWVERLHLGSAMGSLEGWLGVRSMRTFDLRVQRQSQSATALATWLYNGLHDASAPDGAAIRAVVVKVVHASLQTEDMHWLRKQMPGGFGPVFGLWLKSRDMAKALPATLDLFHHATSLGGVESLIEWRRMSDEHIDERLLRVSVGVENVEDIKQDLLQGFARIASTTKDAHNA